MYRPTYNEIPQGFRFSSDAVDLSLVSTSGFGGATWNGFVAPRMDIAGANFRSDATLAFPQYQLRCMGISMPLNGSQRDAYFLSLQGYAFGATFRLVPFVGRVYDTGTDVAITVADILVGDQNFANGVCSCNFTGALRPNAVYTGGGSVFFGVAVWNAGAAGNLGPIRVSINATRFNRPDVALNLAVQ